MGVALELEDKTFGKWKVKKLIGYEAKLHSRVWECECECGEIRKIPQGNLTTGKSSACNSCALTGLDRLSQRSAIYPGSRFGNLTIVELAGRTKSSKTLLYSCKCDCGNERVVRSTRLKDGSIVDCGCALDYKKQVRLKEKNNLTVRTKRPYKGKVPSPFMKIYGFPARKHPLYNIWDHMRGRCNKPSNTAYRDYGGRGIKVCSDWDQFEDFYLWSLENGWERDKGLSIDRIDVNGNYHPNNCRWATQQVQNSNRRNTRIINYHGNKICPAKIWLKVKDYAPISYAAFYTRLVSGWDFEKTINTPSARKKEVLPNVTR